MRRRTGLSPWRMTALLFCTKKPRQEKLVEPQTAALRAGLSTTMVLLCWRPPIFWRLTLATPAEAMRRNEVRPLGGLWRKQGKEGLIRIIAAIAIDEGLGDDKTPGEGDIELSWIGLAAKLDSCLLKFAVAEFIEVVHEHGGDAINE